MEKEEILLVSCPLLLQSAILETDHLFSIAFPTRLGWRSFLLNKNISASIVHVYYFNFTANIHQQFLASLTIFCWACDSRTLTSTWHAAHWHLSGRKELQVGPEKRLSCGSGLIPPSCQVYVFLDRRVLKHTLRNYIMPQRGLIFSVHHLNPCEHMF